MATTLGTRLGTLLGRQLGTGAEGAGVAPIYALSGTSLSDLYLTSATGVEPGDATGWGYWVLGTVNAVAAVARSFVSMGSNALTIPANAWTLQAYMKDGANVTRTVNLPLAASDAGKLIVAHMSWDGTTQRIETHRGDLSASVAMTGYALATAGSILAGYETPAPGTKGLVAVASYRGVMTLSQRRAYFDAARTAGNLPKAIDGVTPAHRWSFQDALQGQNLASGSVGPVSIPDTVTGVAGHAWGRSGSPTITAIDPSVDGRRTYGVLGGSASNYLTTAGGVAGTDAGFWFGGLIRPWATTGNRAAFGKSAASNAGGWFLYLASANMQLQARNADGTSITGLPVYTFSAGALLHVICWLTGSAWSMAVNGIQIGTPVAPNGYLPFNGPFTVGGLNNGAVFAASDVDVFGVGAAHAVPTMAQITASYAATMASGRFVPPTAGGMHFDISRDIEANGGAVPATIQDRIGTDHLTRVGTGLQVAQRVERVWSYETTPILRGAEAMTLADYFEAAINALPGDPNGFLVGALFKVTSQAVASTNRHLAGQRGTGNPGWDLRTSGTNTGVSFGLGSASAATTSPSSTLTAADLGKLILATGVWDGPALSARLYTKRALVASGTSLATGFVPDTAVRAQLGRRVGTPVAADGLVLYGFCYCVGVPTLAQMQAHHDHVMATERMQLPPGMPGTLIDLSTDIAGATMPDTLVDRGTGGVNFTRVGSPTVSPQYARAWAW